MGNQLPGKSEGQPLGFAAIGHDFIIEGTDGFYTDEGMRFHVSGEGRGISAACGSPWYRCIDMGVYKLAGKPHLLAQGCQCSAIPGKNSFYGGYHLMAYSIT